MHTTEQPHGAQPEPACVQARLRKHVYRLVCLAMRFVTQLPGYRNTVSASAAARLLATHSLQGFAEAQRKVCNAICHVCFDAAGCASVLETLVFWLAQRHLPVA